MCVNIASVFYSFTKENGKTCCEKSLIWISLYQMFISPSSELEFPDRHKIRVLCYRRTRGHGIFFVLLTTADDR